MGGAELFLAGIIFQQQNTRRYEETRHRFAFFATARLMFVPISQQIDSPKEFVYHTNIKGHRKLV